MGKDSELLCTNAGAKDRVLKIMIRRKAVEMPNLQTQLSCRNTYRCNKNDASKEHKSYVYVMFYDVWMQMQQYPAKISQPKPGSVSRDLKDRPPK